MNGVTILNTIELTKQHPIEIIGALIIIVSVILIVVGLMFINSEIMGTGCVGIVLGFFDYRVGYYI